VNAVVQAETLNSWLERFDRREMETEPEWLRSLRNDAFARFCQAGFPTTKDEDWRFTNVQAISRTAFDTAPDPRDTISTKELQRFLIPGVSCRLVFVNGRFAPALSQTTGLPSETEVGSLAQALAARAESSEQLGRYASYEQDSFVALNTAFFEDGAYIHIPPKTVLESPIHLLYLSLPGDRPAMAHTRNLIVVDAGSQVCVLEDYVSLDDNVFFSNVVTELVAAEGSVVSLYRIQRESLSTYSISTLHIHQDRDAHVTSHSLLLGGALVRNNVHPVLAGEGAECLVNGLFVGKGRQHVDNYMLVEHASPHCSSRQFYNGVLDDEAHGVFHGRIIVHKDAQKTDAKQTNRNLLLSDNARIDSKPQLEIYADDVKCTHGATIGQVEEDALFYLRSRGIDEVSARHLMLFAFASECLQRMRELPVREHLQQVVQLWLPSGLAPVNLAIAPETPSEKVV